MDRLDEYLQNVASGKISDTSQLGELLAACWEQFEGDNCGMEPTKLHGRMEDVHWRKPELTFQIERHGATVQGSSRAELQNWTLNLTLKTRTCGGTGHRQVRPMQSRLDVKAIAKEIASLIGSQQNDHRLKWYHDGRVRVLIGEILPGGSAVKQTLAGRRKRFWRALDDRLTPDWERLGQSYSRRHIGH